MRYLVALAVAEIRGSDDGCGMYDDMSEAIVDVIMVEAENEEQAWECAKKTRRWEGYLIPRNRYDYTVTKVEDLPLLRCGKAGPWWDPKGA